MMPTVRLNMTSEGKMFVFHTIVLGKSNIYQIMTVSSDDSTNNITLTYSRKWRGNRWSSRHPFFFATDENFSTE